MDRHELMDSEDEADLRWYWNEAEGDMGLRSNFAAMVACLELGGPAGGLPVHDDEEGRLKAAGRERRVRRAIELLSARDVTILVHAFGSGSRKLPPFGRATGVVPLTAAARLTWANSGTTRPLGEWLVRLVCRVHGGLGNRPAQDRALAQTIRREAESMLLGAMRAYAAARSGPSGSTSYSRAA
jgi:hypothetical protein